MVRPVSSAGSNQFRQNASAKPDLLIRQLETLSRLTQSRDSRHVKRHLLRHADMILREGERSVPEENDRRDILRRYQAFRLAARSKEE